MNTRKTTAKSLDDVAAFVSGCNDNRFPDSRPLFEPSPEDVIAEAKPEGRLITPRRTNPHD